MALTVHRSLRTSVDTVRTLGDMDIEGTFIQLVMDLVTGVMHTVFIKGANGVIRILKPQGPTSLAFGTLLGVMERWELTDHIVVLRIRMVWIAGGGPLGLMTLVTFRLTLAVVVLSPLGPLLRRAGIGGLPAPPTRRLALLISVADAASAEKSRLIPDHAAENAHETIMEMDRGQLVMGQSWPRQHGTCRGYEGPTGSICRTWLMHTRVTRSGGGLTRLPRVRISHNLARAPSRSMTIPPYVLWRRTTTDGDAAARMRKWLIEEGASLTLPPRLPRTRLRAEFVGGAARLGRRAMPSKRIVKLWETMHKFEGGTSSLGRWTSMGAAVNRSDFWRATPTYSRPSRTMPSGWRSAIWLVIVWRWIQLPHASRRSGDVSSRGANSLGSQRSTATCRSTCALLCHHLNVHPVGPPPRPTIVQWRRRTRKSWSLISELQGANPPRQLKTIKYNFLAVATSCMEKGILALQPRPPPLRASRPGTATSTL